MSIIDDILAGLQEVGDVLSSVASEIQALVSEGLDAFSDDIVSITEGITTTLTNMATNLATYLGDIAQDIQDSISAGLSNLLTAISEASNQIGGMVSDGLAYVLDLIDGISQALALAITDGLTQVGGLVTSVTEGLTLAIDTLQSEITSTIDSLGTTFGGLVNTLDTAVSGLQDTIVQTLDPMRAVEAVRNALSSYNVDIGKAFMERVHFKRGVIDRILNGEYSNFPDMVRDLADPPDKDDGFSGFGDLISVLIATVLALPAMSEPYARMQVQKIERHLQNQVLSPEVLASMTVQSVMTKAEAAEQATYSGLTPEKFDLLYQLAGDPPGGETILELLNRGEFTEAEAKQAVLESRLKPKYTDAFLKLRNVIPPISDIIEFAVKDTFDTDAVKRFSLDENYPLEIDPFLKMKGLDDKWAHRYWQAHWRQPSVEQVFEMLWRSPETGITSDDVDKYLKTADIPPFWRNKLKQIAYKVFTRVDVRRMYKVGVLDRPGVAKAYRDMGYDAERAEALADFTVKLEDETGGLSPDNQERRLWTQAVDLYTRGQRTLPQLRQIAQGFGWSGKALENELTLADWRLEEYKAGPGKDKALLDTETLERRTIEETVKLYIAGHRSLDDIATLMRDYDIDQDTITMELKIANLRKEGAKKPDKTEELRDLSINAIIDAFDLSAITEAEALEKLQDVGLSEHDAQLEIEIAKLQAASKIKSTIITSLKSAYLAGLVTEAQATQKLVEFGFPPVESQQYLSVWTLEETLKHKSLTEAQLASMVKKGVITEAEYKAELKLQGYNQVQVDRLALMRGAEVIS